MRNFFPYKKKKVELNCDQKGERQQVDFTL